MSIASKIYNMVLALKGAEIGGWTISRFQDGRPYIPDRNYSSLVTKYSSWVYACTQMNAVNIAQVPLRLFVEDNGSKTKCLFPTAPAKSNMAINRGRYTKATEIVEITEHPLLELLKSVNDFMNQFDLMESLSSYLDLTGNAAWVLQKGPLGIPDQIWPLMPQFLRPIVSKTKFITAWEYRVNNEKHIIPPEEVIAFKTFNPRSLIMGVGPLEASIVSADLNIEMGILETSLMKNRAVPEFVMSYPVDSGKPDTDERKRIREDWNKQYKGSKRAGKFGFLFGGAEIKQISLSPKEMAFLQGRKWTREEICNCYGVPVSKFTSDNVNRANAEAGDFQYMKNSILPRLTRIEQKLNEQLVPLFDPRMFLAFDNPVPQDREFRLKQIETHLKTGYSSINLERQKDNQEEVEWGNDPILPANMIPLGSSPLITSSEPGKIVKSARRFPPLNHPTNFINEPLIADLSKWYGRVEDDVLSEMAKDEALLKRYKGREDDFARSWFAADKWVNDLDNTLAPHWQATITEGKRRAALSINEFVINPGTPLGSRALAQHRTASLRGINNTIAKRLRENLARGLSEGEGFRDIRGRVTDMFGKMKDSSAARIARTETIWAWNEGAVLGYQAAGVQKKEWLSSDDDRTCEFCPVMDGKIVEVSNDYHQMGGEDLIGNRGGKLGFEFEAVGHPPLHPSCRCTVIPVIE